MHNILHFDSPLQCQLGVGFSCGNGEGNGGVGRGVIYTNTLIAAVPSVLRETLSSCLSAILRPWATTAGHLQLHQTKEPATCPQRPSLCHNI